MASIALFDIDFWYGRKQYPNLELMKVFNYYYSQNHIVVFTKPNQDLERFNKIFYFFENTNIQIPKSLFISNDKSQCYGCGFYNSFRPLINPINDSPPSFIPYDLEEDKIKDLKNYNKIKRRSLIRLENKDFTNFDSNKRHIYLADHDVLYQNDIESFIKEYNKFNLNCYYPLNIYSEDKLDRVNQYSQYFKGNRYNLLFNYTKETFDKYGSCNYIFNFNDFTTKDNRIKFIKSILYLKAKGLKPYFNKFNKIPTELEPIFKWYNSGLQESYYSYISDKPELITQFNLNFKNDSDYRLLLKQNPKTLNCLTFTI